ncbi:MAG: hypothetical protein WBA35_04015, partial [Litorimonas sp.]
MPAVDRRRKRLDIDDLAVPSAQANMNAVRFGLQLSDVAVLGSVIMAVVWTSYVGMNQNSVLAPVAAASLGCAIFVMMLLIGKAYRFKPTERTSEHLKTTLVAGLAALGLWLSAALILRPDSFLPDSLAKAGLLAIAALLGLHAIYSRQLQKMH